MSLDDFVQTWPSLLKVGEALPPSRIQPFTTRLSLTHGNLFPGDWRVGYRCFDNRCQNQGFLTCDEITAIAVLVARNDKKRPGYRHGNKIMKEHLNICLNEDRIYRYETVQDRILKKLDRDLL